jgi:hypothetical protein
MRFARNCRVRSRVSTLKWPHSITSEGSATTTIAVCRVYGWEEKKAKAAWGGMTVDYEAIAGKAVREMKGNDLQRFLVVCALVSDLYCPGYNPRQVLAKDSNLARTAARYKIDAAKIAAEVRAELAKNAEKEGNGQPKAKAPVKPN